MEDESETRYYVAEKGVPIPPPGQGAKKYPYDKMQPGDSFLVPEKEGSSAYIACKAACDIHGWKWTQRKTPEGTRIWRTE